MSFKRDGDDVTSLRSLQKRRVSELLVADIPEDEAFLTKNGRLACLVCSHRPVLDNISALTVHRQGRKHAACDEYFQEKKMELERLREQRRQELSAKQKECVPAHPRPSHPVAPPPALGPFHPLLVSAAYSSLAQRHRPYERRRVLDLPATNSPAEKPVTKIAAKSQTLSAEDAVPQMNPYTSRFEACFQMDAARKDDVRSAKGNVGGGRATNGESGRGFAPRFGLDRKTIAIEAKHLGRPEKLTNSLFYRRRKEAKERESTGGSSSDRSGGLVIRSLREGCSSDADWLKGPSDVAVVDIPKVVQSAPPLRQTEGKKKKEEGSRKRVEGPVTERCELFLKAISSGWKRDRGGEWVKDDDAEFDSDEEPPTVS